MQEINFKTVVNVKSSDDNDETTITLDEAIEELEQYKFDSMVVNYNNNYYIANDISEIENLIRGVIKITNKKTRYQYIFAYGIDIETNTIDIKTNTLVIIIKDIFDLLLQLFHDFEKDKIKSR